MRSAASTAELYLAVRRNNPSELRKLLASERIRSCGDLGRKKWTGPAAPLHYAAKKGWDEMIRMMIEAGFDVDSYHSHGNDNPWTSLQWAARYGRKSTVRLLLDLGADWTLCGDSKGTLLDWARRERLEGMVKILERHAAVKKAKAVVAEVAACEPNLSAFTSSSQASATNSKSVHVNQRAMKRPLQKDMAKTFEYFQKTYLNFLTGLAEVTPKSQPLKEISVQTISDNPLVSYSVKSLVAKLGSKRMLESDLERASKISDSIDEEVRKLEPIRKQIDMLTSEERRIKDLIANLKKDPDYKSEKEDKRIRLELKEIDEVTQAVKTVFNDDPDKHCPVCFKAPEMVFSCVGCHNWICGKCWEGKGLQSCPSCRVDFKMTPPLRNHTAERLLKFF